MPPGPDLLAWSTALFVPYLGAQSIFYLAEYGIGFAASGRDRPRPPRRPYLARAERALRNLLETYAVFVALAVALELGRRSSPLALAGEQTYLAARLIYLPLYLLAVPYLRNIVWLVAILGLGLMFVAAVLP